MPLSITGSGSLPTVGPIRIPACGETTVDAGLTDTDSRIDRRRTVTLTVDPPAAMSLEEAIGVTAGLARLRDEVFDAVLVSHEPGELDALRRVPLRPQRVGETGRRSKPPAQLRLRSAHQKAASRAAF